MPLIVRGARQIGKTDAIENFANNNYKHIVEINFTLPSKLCIGLSFDAKSSNLIICVISAILIYK